MKAQKKPQFDVQDFLTRAGGGQSTKYVRSATIFAQGEPADALFYIRKGKVKLTVISEHGKQAVITTLKAGDFLGEGCLAGQPLRMSSAMAVSDCSLVRLPKPAAAAVLRNEPAFSMLFLHYLLIRNIQIEDTLVNQILTSSEKRLARVLLLLANFGSEGKPRTVIPKISQELLAQIIGTTRSSVRFFMNRFRKMGFIDDRDGLEIHSSLLNVLLQD